MNILNIIKEEIQKLNEQEFIVYHGTNNEFDKFDDNMIGSNTGANWNGRGFYFSDNKSEAILYGKHLLKAKINLNNPINLTNIKDSSVQGSGLIRFVSNLKGFENIRYGDYSIKQITNILNDLENNFNPKNISFSEGTNKSFRHVWYDYDGEEYVLRNLTDNEINDINYLKSRIIGQILYKAYDISRLPIIIQDLMSPSQFTNIAEKNGYDGVIAPNSTVSSGNEYVVFDTKNIEDLTKNINENKVLNEQEFIVYHGTNNKFNEFDLDKTAEGVVWFTNSINSIKNGTHGGDGSKYILKRKITINNPAGWDEYEKYSIGELINMGYDGIILPEKDKIDYVVFDVKQIKKM